MKKSVIIFLLVLFLGGCKDDLLEQYPPDQISEEMFWKTIEDASSSTSGVYAAMRDYFGYDYLYDANTDVAYGMARGNETGNPDGMRNAWDGCYRIVNRANATLAGISNMLPGVSVAADKAQLERLQAEVRFLRAMAYFRLVDFFGAVPYMDRPLTHEQAIQLTRMPVQAVRDSILADLNFAVDHLPESYSGSDYGRATKWAALAYRGKFNLYWASWIKNGRPQWNAAGDQAGVYFERARDDFKTIMDQSGHDLFRGGEPGEYHDPNYRQLFSLENEQCEEIIFSIQYHGPAMGLGSEMKAIFSSRQGGNNGAIQPTIKLVDLYLKLDGTEAPPLIPSTDKTLPNGAINRDSYAGRDWRMRASVLWDGEKVLLQNGGGTEMAADSAAFMWGNPGTGHLDDPYYDYYNHKVGYAFRKWMPTYLGYSRYDCPQDFYLVRYADVLLMYAECVNEINNGPTLELQNIINYVRKRGNIQASATIASMGKEEFFDLLVRERAVEFIAEGQRFFDIRRWRLAEEVWNNGQGFVLTDTWGTIVQEEFVNAQAFQFQRFYTAQIPQEEINMNPNLIQNEPWL